MSTGQIVGFLCGLLLGVVGVWILARKPASSFSSHSQEKSNNEPLLLGEGRVSHSNGARL